MSHNQDIESQIPEHLLSDCSEKDKYILNSISVINQSVSNLRINQERNYKVLNNICELQKIANGRVTKAEVEINKLKEIKPTVDQIKDDIRLIVLIKKALGNKLTYIFILLIAIGSYTVFNAVTTNKTVQKDINIISPVIQAINP